MHQLQNGTWRSCSASKIANPTFNTIPPELKSNIFSFIKSPADLKSLCLTSKAVRDIAVPFLYEEVAIDVGGPGDSLISGLMNPLNPGIQHIKRWDLGMVEVYSAIGGRHSELEDSNQGHEDLVGSAVQAHVMIRILLEALPKNRLANKLQSFRWTTWEPFSRDNWVLLLKTQTQLTSLEISPLDRPYTPILSQIPSLVEGLTNLSNLYLFATSLDELRAFQKVLQVRPKIKVLKLISNWKSKEEAPEDLEDNSFRPGLMFRTIFSHMMPFDNCSPIEPRSITVDSIGLRYADRFLMKAVAFKSLDFLSICNCGAPDGVFAHLSQSHQLPFMLKTLIWCQTDRTEPHVLNAFERVLEMLPVLECLHVELGDAHRLPEAKAVSHSAILLRSLLVRVHDSDNPMPVYKPEEFDEICTKCTSLRELSMVLPLLDLEQRPYSPDWETFHNSLKKLPDLVTFNMQNSPQTKLSLVAQYHPKSESLYLYDNQLQRLAQHIFTTSDANAKSRFWGLGHRSRLAVIAFGANGESWYAQENGDTVKLKQTIFTRGESIDALGRRSMVATKTLWRHLDYIEPESDILSDLYVY